MKYSQIRAKYQHHEYLDMVFVDPYAQLVSPFLTKLCLKLGLIPNAVTILMIGFGIIGAALFAVPCLACRIIGAVFIHLWYIADCSDGEVARITGRFSRFGTEIDYTAHVINHPLFIFSFTLALVWEFGAGHIAVFLAGFAVAALDLAFRCLVVFDGIYRDRMSAGEDEPVKKDTAESVRPSRLKRIVMYAVNIFIQLPNFCLIFPVIFFISPKAGFIYMLAVLCVCAVVVPYYAVRWLMRIVNK